MRKALCSVILTFILLPISHARAEPPVGYYRMPAIHGDTIVFVAEGDLWKVGARGGAATRLTSHPGEESRPAISPDGTTLAFTAQYEGPSEVYTMPMSGGLPTRLTWESDQADVVGWTPDGKVLYATTARSTLPNLQLFTIDSRSGRREAVPLAQASEGVYDDTGQTLFFTRLPFQGSHTKRYRGGRIQQIWTFAPGSEVRPLTGDFSGTSRNPMWWKGRIYFISDRDGTMNLWSMKPDGSDLRQHTKHSGWDIGSPSLSEGRVAYQLGADLRLYDVASGGDAAIPITLDSDLDQTREHWIAKPIDYLTAVHVAPEGDRVVLTARGRVFVAPHRQGRFVEVAHKEGVRCRDARFMPDGKSLLALSDESGEVEIWRLPANGVGPSDQLTTDGAVLRWEAAPSPDGRYVAHHDKNQRLWIYDVEKKSNTKIDESEIDGFSDLRWSPDSRWLAYVVPSANLYSRIWIYSVGDGSKIPLTSDRYDSYSPAWSPDGRWLYFLSDRNLKSVVESPWGSMQPEPFFDRKTRLYQIALQEGLRSPFAPADELHPEKSGDSEKKKEQPETQGAGGKPGKESPQAEEARARSGKEAPKPDAGAKDSGPKVEVVVDRKGIEERLLELPVPPGNYANLMLNDKALFWLSSDTGVDAKSHLVGAAIARENVEVKTILEDVKSAEISLDGKKLLIRKGDLLYLIDAAPSKADLDKKDVILSAWTLSVIPREEWRQMFVEAWRLERDYFYDTDMHGVDWKGTLKKYMPLVDRVRSRGELSDLIAQMVSELSALHTFVRGGDLRKGADDVEAASLGAVLDRDERAGGFRVAHIYRSDPDEPARRSPLARPGVDVKEGDVIEMIDGTATLSVPDPAMLLRKKAGRQVLLRVKPAAGGESRDAIATPMSRGDDFDLRYHEWEYTRRLKVEESTGGEIGYVHLRAMGRDNFSEWARGFYPAFNRQALIIDVRNNRGGNIDSWILSRLLRKAWFYWSQRVGRSPVWNMQYAFRGHIAVLCNDRTASDGEAFAEGIKRLGLGKVFGTRTWGGEIWLSSNNFLVDRGIATAAETGVFGPEGEWLIEGHGVDPDVVVDNLPNETFQGRDAQLEAAVQYLKERIREQPVVLPPVPKHPDKSLKPGR